MGIKAYLFTDEDCLKRCEDARAKLKGYLDSGEIQEMDVHEGLKTFNLGEPGGVPFIGIIAESTGECISQVYFNPEEKNEPQEEPTENEPAAETTE